MAFISIKNLFYKYKKNNEDGENTGFYKSIDDISFDINEGDYIAILGRNGSGKSTLAKNLNSILFPTEGSILIDGNEVDKESIENIYYNRTKIGMVFQNPDNQIVGSIVEEDTAFGPENLRIKSNEIRQVVDESLNAVGMKEYSKSSTNQLSGGQKQRIAIAGILSMNPKCIILDEATSMLDPIGKYEVIDIVKKLNKQKKITIILITHIMEEALNADKVLVINNGKLVASGSPKDVFSDADVLAKAGLEEPIVKQMSNELRKSGIDISESIYTVNDFVNECERLYRIRKDKSDA